MKIVPTLLVTLAFLSTPLLAQEGRSVAPGAQEGRADQARVEVHKGRCVVLSGGRGERSLRQGEDARLEGATHLEVGAGSEVRISWPGRASVHLWGPAALQWDERPGPAGDVTANHTERGLEWHLFDVAWADFEVRRGEHRLFLPGDWRCQLETGATYVRGLAGGPVELRHQAGSPLTLDWVGDADHPRPPMSVYAGSSVRLDRPPTTRADEDSQARAWERPAWPYRAPVDRPGDDQRRQELERRTQRNDRFPTQEQPLPVERARVPEFTDRTGVKVEFEPVSVPEGAPRPTPQAPSVERPGTVEPTPVAPFTGQPAVQQVPVTEPVLPEALQAPEPPPAFQAEQWGGRSLEQLEPCGPLAVEKVEGVELRLFASGRRKIFVDSEAPRGVWCFAPDQDHLLAPGTVAVFEADGSLRMAFGEVTSRPAPDQRPSFDTLQR